MALGHFRSRRNRARASGVAHTHPRFSPDGRKVVIDSAHEGGRQLYLIDAGPLFLLNCLFCRRKAGFSMSNLLISARIFVAMSQLLKIGSPPNDWDRI